MLKYLTIATLFVCSLVSASTEKDMTFMVFLNGHSNLDPYGPFNIRQMETKGSDDKLNIIVQWASEKAKDTKRLYVIKNTKSRRVISPVMETLPRVDMGDPQALVDFVTWGIKNYPAKHYAVVLWSHGSGWKLFKSDLPVFKDISFDDFTGNSISTSELGEAMRQVKQYLGRNLDILAIDSCLMQMIEVATEIKASVDFFLGSEETIPGEGWPYDKILHSLPDYSVDSFSKTIVEQYLQHYSRKSVTYSALDLSYSTEIQHSVVEFIKTLLVTEKSKIREGLNKADKYYYRSYVDLGDFAKHMNNIEVQNSLKKYVVYSGGTMSHKNSQGVSIWIPSKYEYDTNVKRYKTLIFDKETNWSDFLNYLTN